MAAAADTLRDIVGLMRHRWYLLLVLPVALLAIALALSTASAESPADPLQPTQIVAEIPQTPGKTFPLQWGGGSLHHFKARLAALGCIADQIWLPGQTPDDGWRAYSQYQVPSSLNRAFLDDYREHLPAGGLYATCYDPCDFRYLDDPPGADIPCGAHPSDLSAARRADWAGGVGFGSGEPCNDDWHPLVAERVLPDLPRHPAACIIRADYCPPPITGIAAPEFESYYFRLSRFGWIQREYPVNTPGIVVCQRAAGDEDAALFIELHEACHLAQSWSALAWLAPDRPLEPAADPYRNRFEESPAGLEFERLAGFQLRLTRWFFRTSADWLLPPASPWLRVYNASPIELAAELCAERLARRLGLDSPYAAIQPDVLTPETAAWIDRWLLLPELLPQRDASAG